ncbi:FAD-dependent oxidoreductase [Hippea maritima]|uniref:CoA-disulfide reductase n=1 Tax=Hippea maritima (strain ATCC 700847 / DSM 10411 / MH2) TaxID=760142 RepID=F2LW84_HIPMA|nr:FAD-dependent oxidoreductase [Hippea maritima]AEA34018.1 CoA-disulfide reductase [Hippea maritima DSM 10411]
MERPLKVVVIGGDAAGMSAASQVKRRIKSAEVIVVEKGRDVSYGACGMPYNIGYQADIDELVVLTADEFKTKRGIDVRLLSEAVGVDFNNRKVKVRSLASDREYELVYDKLFIGSGAEAFLPPIEGAANEGVFKLKVLDDARRIKAYIEDKKPKKAVLIGAGFINLELAENLKRLSMEVVILEKLDGILLNFEDEFSEVVKEELSRNGVELITGVDIEKIDGSLKVKTNKGEFEADFVNIAAGVKPNTDFLVGTPIELEKGAIVVDRYFRTNMESVYAGGDCALIYHRILNRNVYMPLGTNANKAGRIGGANMAGANEEFAGIVGTILFRIFDKGVAKTGLSLREAIDNGFDAFKTIIEAPTTAHGFPHQGKVKICLVAEKGSGRLLGGQIVGDSEGVWRIDILATALYSNLAIKDIQGLDLAYSPPFAPVWDPILVCANQAIKQVRK